MVFEFANILLLLRFWLYHMCYFEVQLGNLYNQIVHPCPRYISLMILWIVSLLYLDSDNHWGMAMPESILDFIIWYI